jgi:hypothetical protein
MRTARKRVARDIADWLVVVAMVVDRKGDEGERQS